MKTTFFSTLRLLALCALSLSVIHHLPAADVTVTAANVIVSSQGRQFLSPGTFGEAVTAGQSVYLSATDNKYYLSDVNVPTKAAIAGVAVNSGAANQPAMICTEDPDFTPGFTMSLSTPVYVASATPGGIAPAGDLATGWKPTVLYVAKSTTKCSFRARGHTGTAQ